MAINFLNAGQFPDNAKLNFGDSQDLEIFHQSSSSNCFIQNNTGNLRIINNTNDGDITFESDDGSGGLATYFYVDGSGTRTIFEKLTRHNDDVYAAFGSDSDLRIYHDGSNSYIKQVTSATGDLIIEQDVADKDIIFKCDDGSGGTTEYFKVDGSAENISISKNTVRGDDVKAYWGDSNDLQLYHDSNNSYIVDNGTGNMIIAGNQVYITNAAGSEYKAQFTTDGRCKLIL